MNQNKLKNIQVITSDKAGCVWAIPYKMRDGQSPLDIKESHRKDWIFLCTLSGWYGDKTKEELQDVKTLLAFTGMPSYAGEWFDVEYDCKVCGDGILVPFFEDGLYMSGCLHCKAEIANYYQSRVNSCK